MSPCPRCGAPAKHVAVRVPWTPDLPIQVEHECQAYGCQDRLVPFLEEAMDPEAVLRRVFGVRGELAAVAGPARNGAQPQPETLWVLVDSAGQPCLNHLAHGRPTGIPSGLDPEFIPYAWAPYRLAPVPEAPTP